MSTASKNQSAPRRLQIGALSAGYVVLFIALIVVLNIIVGVMTQRLGLKFDMTAAKVYSLSSETRQMLSDMDQEVVFHVLATEDSIHSVPIGEILDRYRQASNGMIALDFVDPDKNPTFISRYTSSESLSEGSVIVESAQRFRIVPLSDFYVTNGTAITGLRADEVLSSAILFVTADNVKTCTIVKGHDEIVPESLKSFLGSANYSLQTVNLALSDIPEETSLVVISAPAKDFLESEIDRLDIYFNKPRSNCIVLLDVTAGRLPALEEYLGEWGISLDHALIIDEDRSVTSVEKIAPLFYTDAPIVNKLVSDSLVLAPQSMPMHTVESVNPNRRVTPLMASSASSYAVYVESGSKVDVTNVVSNGPYDVALLASQDLYESGSVSTNYLLALTSPGMTSSALLNHSSFANEAFFSEAIDLFEDEDATITISERSLNNLELIVMKDTQSYLIAILIAIPCLILLLGLVVWIKRRHL